MSGWWEGMYDALRDGYSPEDPEDAFEPVGPYTSEDLAFLVNAQVEGEEPAWISETPESGE